MNFAPADGHNEALHRRQLATAANSALRGEVASVGVIAVAAGSTQAILKDQHIGAGKSVYLSPTSQAAAAVDWWMDESTLVKGEVTVRFIAAPSANCTFNYVILGGKRLGVKGV